MKKSMITISTILAVALITASAYAWGPGRGMGRGGYNGDCPRYGSYNTNLTQEQQTQLSTLQQKYIDETYELRSQMFQKNQEMRLLMETSSPDRNKLMAISGEIDDISKQLREKRIDFALEAKKISPEINFGQGRGKRGGFGRWGKGDCFQSRSGQPGPDTYQEQ